MLFEEVAQWLTAAPSRKDAKWQCFCSIVENKGMIKSRNLWLYMVVMVVTLASCELIGDIFKAGFWAAIIVVVLVIALIIWIINRMRR